MKEVAGGRSSVVGLGFVGLGFVGLGWQVGGEESGDAGGIHGWDFSSLVICQSSGKGGGGKRGLGARAPVREPRVWRPLFAVGCGWGSPNSYSDRVVASLVFQLGRRTSSHRTESPPTSIRSSVPASR